MQRHSGDLGRDSGEGGAGRTGFASSARVHSKTSGWSLVCNELLTKILPMFLSILNEIGGDHEKIVPVSESF